MKKILSLLFVLALSLSLASCKKSDSNELLVLLDWQPNTNHTGLYVAQKLGYYEEAGLKVRIEQPGDTGTSVMVATGKAEFGIDFQDQMVPNHAKGINTTAIAAIIQHNTSGILSLKEANITSPKDMEGKTYATWSLPIEQKIVSQVMENDGASFDKVKLYPEFVQDAITSMKLGQIDCAWVFEGWDVCKAKVDGVDFNYFDFKTFDKRLDFYTPVIIGNNDYISKNPETTKAFLEATKKGYLYAIENPEEAAKILHEVTPETDLNILIESQKFLAHEYVSDAPKWGYIDPVRWNAFYSWINENQLAEKEIPADFGFSNAYLA